jgi:hypothetical protein
MAEAEAEEDPRLLRVATGPLAAYLPVVAKLRLAATSRALRAALETRYATCVDLSPSSGVRADSVTDAALLAAVALSHGCLQVLDARGCSRLTRTALANVLAASAATLREVHLCDVAREQTGGAGPAAAPSLACSQATALLATAPHMRVYNARLDASSVDEAVALVHAAAQRSTLHVRATVKLSGKSVADHVHSALALMTLSIGLGLGQALPPSAPPFAGAVRASGDGMSLAFLGELHGAVSAPELLAALQAHPRVRCVELVLPGDAFDWTEDDEGAEQYPLAEALGALVGADSPALQQLHVRAERVLTAEDLTPLVESLRLNTHLTELHVSGVAGEDSDAEFAEFARSTLLPAVAANDSLRMLRICGERALPALREAEALVQQRSSGA